MLRFAPRTVFIIDTLPVSVAELMWGDCTLQIFKDHMIDGETLPLLSEEHLLDTLGLKLGPALKIRSQVKKLYLSH